MKEMKNRYDIMNNYLISLLYNVNNFEDLCNSIYSELPQLCKMKFINIFLFSHDNLITSVLL